MAVSIAFIRQKHQAANELKDLLREVGIVVVAEDELPHGLKLHAVYEDKYFALVLYFTVKTGQSSKVVLEKATDEITGIVTSAVTGIASVPSPLKPVLQEVRGQSHIGIDESGKGDYFGPLVIAGVCIKPEDELRLVEIGVRDSKLLSGKQVAALAGRIRSLLGEWRYDVAYINPEKYNELYSKMRNLNRLLGWGHARVLENLLARNDCNLAVCDQFGDESYINKALMERGKAIKLIQTPKAEQDLAVAAASILARDTFVRKLGEMSERYDIGFPKGASRVVEIAKEFITTYGGNNLAKVAKLHFKTTEKVLKGS